MRPPNVKIRILQILRIFCYFCKSTKFDCKFVFVIIISYICNRIIYIVKYRKNMIERIKRIITERDMTLSSFANTTGIHPTTLSHIINGREIAGKGKVKQIPSTDVIMKILSAFPDINAEWLIRGTGPMDKNGRTFIQPDLFSEPAAEPPSTPTHPKYRQKTEEVIEEKVEQIATKNVQKQTLTPELSISDNIDKIVIFLKNNTYITLKPE